ncbi:MULTISPECIES: ABC transporter permease [Mameliella]|uniref:Autoinducer 2 import system permease protein LsrD n=1 Tax=Mameliella alba TaxID=561184 RepID=A0A0B3RTM9_9RHOB|nr:MULTISPECIES: ABC transporter permease [Mameliella]KHQ50123.1 Monosaccharide ABC transporter membrane protein, CUT2 family [Mameliella alba]
MTDTATITTTPSRAIRFAQRNPAILYLVVLVGAFGLIAPEQFTIGSATTVVQLSIPLVSIAIGMTLCLVCGEVDLSVGGVAGLASTITALLVTAEWHWPLAVLAALAAGGAVGLVNGLFTALLIPSFPRFPSFLVTLATLSITLGIAQSLQPLQQSIAINDASFQVAFRFASTIPASPPFWYMVALVVVAHVLLSRARFGYAAYAVGTNPRAAELVGHSAVRIRASVMVISGLTAAFGGVMLAGFVQAGFGGIAQGVEIDAIAAAVIGGAALTGGRGSIIGTVWGVLILGVLNTGLLVLQVTTNWQLISKGGLVILALVIAEALHRRAVQSR